MLEGACILNHNVHNDGYFMDETDVIVTHGVLDENARRAFTWGHCHAMALALHHETGWDIVAVFQNGRKALPDVPPSHFAVYCPDGRLLDANGCYAEGELPHADQAYMDQPNSYRPSNAEEIYAIAGDTYRDLDGYEAAVSIVPNVLEFYTP